MPASKVIDVIVICICIIVILSICACFKTEIESCNHDQHPDVVHFSKKIVELGILRSKVLIFNLANPSPTGEAIQNTYGLNGLVEYRRP
jgi:hypothetical protein